ncbi:hypothetical protein [Scytonema sp. PCC 10023]|uniref:hypothetical protein n=1 Tax=Scytonema sp. PCC 10023 TaxID=1680591 RepID=UPI0039C5AE6D
MSQKANTQLILPEPSEELIASEPWSIETYADNLMDELFAEIDRILDGNDNLPSQTVLQEDIRQVQTVTVPEIVVPETQLRPIEIQKVAQARNNPLSTLVVGTPGVSRQASKSSQKSQRTNSIVLWVAVTIGLAAASILWVFNSGLLNRLVSKSLQQSLLQPQAQSPLPTKAQIEADLVNYMLGALSVIDRQEAKSSLRSASSANQTALAYITPQRVGGNNIASAPSQSTRVVERIYIPVYQAPQPMRYAPPPTADTPNSATVPESSLGKASKPAPVKMAQPTTTVQALAAVRPELKAVSPKRATDAAASPSLVSENQEVASTVTTRDVTAPSYTLEKLFELGNKSAALFKIDGVTRRVEVGEAIGASGWTLVKIAKGEVTIRRNGEVRSIYTGQTF